MNFFGNRFETYIKPLFRLKPIRPPKEVFHRKLGLFDLTLLGIGSIIGAGIFVITGAAARNLAGPAAFISFCLTGLAMILTALCYGEFAERVRTSGGAYAYAYSQIGEFGAFIVGWLSIAEFSASPAAVSRGWSGYLVLVLKQIGITLPKFFYSIPFLYFEIDFMAISVLIILSLIIAKGVSESTWFNHVVTGFGIIIILIVIIGGFVLADVDNWDEFAPKGLSGILGASAAVVFAFIGFETTATLSEEVKNPGKNLPLGIILSLSISTILYMLVAIAITLMIPYDTIDIRAPLADAFASKNQKWATILVSLGAFASLTTTILVNLIAQPRLYYTMARDGLLNPFFLTINQKTNTPLNSIIFTGVSVVILSQLLGLGGLAELVSISTLLIFVFVDAALVIVKNPDESSTLKIKLLLLVFSLLSLIASFISNYSGILILNIFSWIPVFAIFVWIYKIFSSSNLIIEDGINFKIPGGPIVPLLGVIFNLYLMATIPAFSWIILVIYLILGCIYFFLYSIKHSSLNSENIIESDTENEITEEDLGARNIELDTIPLEE